jgi:GNAT superfamily N-acetyltransferase
MTTLVYEDTNFFSFLEEMKPILLSHYEELCPVKDFPLDPDWDAYKRYDDAGMLRCVTCRADGELIGYIIFFVQPHIHYKTCLTAVEDIYYVKKEFRKGRVGIRLFKYAEEVLKRIGVNRIIYGTKVYLDNSKLFEYLGYKHTDKVFTKLI